MAGIALSIALACLTTAIALTSAVGTFFSELTGGRIGYKTLVTFCCVVSGILAVNGVDNIIQFAYPPLTFVYPIVITLVLYIVLFGRFIHAKTPFIAALIASSTVATLGLLKTFGLATDGISTILDRIPFSNISLGWVVPSIVGFAIGLLLDKVKKRNNSDLKKD